MSTESSETALSQRIQKNCKIIWGDDKEFEIESETDDHIHYYCVVKEDLGLYPRGWQRPLTMTFLCYGQDPALNELDRMLRAWARQVDAGRPMTNEESLEIFSGLRGEGGELLQAFNRLKDQREEMAPQGVVDHVESTKKKAKRPSTDQATK